MFNNAQNGKINILQLTVIGGNPSVSVCGVGEEGGRCGCDFWMWNVFSVAYFTFKRDVAMIFDFWSENVSYVNNLSAVLIVRCFTASLLLSLQICIYLLKYFILCENIILVDSNRKMQFAMSGSISTLNANASLNSISVLMENWKFLISLHYRRINDRLYAQNRDLILKADNFRHY